jgi:hypothetical protein
VSWAIPCSLLDRSRQKTDMMKLIVTTYNSFVNAPKSTMFSQQDCTSALLWQKLVLGLAGDWYSPIHSYILKILDKECNAQKPLLNSDQLKMKTLTHKFMVPIYPFTGHIFNHKPAVWKYMWKHMQATFHTHLHN